MSKKKTDWRYDFVQGLSEGCFIACDPLGVFIQAIGIIRNADWFTIGGGRFFVKDTPSKWAGKLTLVTLAWVGLYFIYDTHWIPILSVQGALLAIDLFLIWWRNRKDKPSPVTVNEKKATQAEPVSTTKPPTPKSSSASERDKIMAEFKKLGGNIDKVLVAVEDQEYSDLVMEYFGHLEYDDSAESLVEKSMVAKEDEWNVGQDWKNFRRCVYEVRASLDREAGLSKKSADSSQSS